MKVKVTLEFDSQQEAAAFLSGDKTVAAPKAEALKAVETVEVPKAAPKAKGKAAPKAAAVKFDRPKAIESIKELYSSILTGSNVAEKQAHLVNLVEQYGGQMKASSVPDENMPEFIKEVESYQASLAEETPVEVEEEESLI